MLRGFRISQLSDIRCPGSCLIIPESVAYPIARIAIIDHPKLLYKTRILPLRIYRRASTCRARRAAGPVRTFRNARSVGLFPHFGDFVWCPNREVGATFSSPAHGILKCGAAARGAWGETLRANLSLMRMRHFPFHINPSGGGGIEQFLQRCEIDRSARRLPLKIPDPFVSPVLRGLSDSDNERESDRVLAAMRPHVWLLL